MTSQERKRQIEILLSESTEPVSAALLAKTFSVSRQLIVGDIALMRAAGLKISATPRGYILNHINETSDNINTTIACSHTLENMALELYAVVDNGGNLLDVTVEHPIYGQIVGELRISSRYDADLFLGKLKEYKAEPLLKLTGGIHLHRLECKDEEMLERILTALREENILLEQK